MNTPWRVTVDGNFIKGQSDGVIANVFRSDYAHHIVACVNACEGMKDPVKEIQDPRDRVKELEGAISNTVMEADTKADEIEGWDSAEGRGASSISRLVSDRLLPYIYPAN